MALGAYQAENTRGSVLNALANPRVVNPVAALGSAAQTYGSMMQAKQLQAQQAIGGILQQSTDQNGNVDYGKAQSLASQAGPVVQMGMQSMLLNNSQLKGAQIAQGSAITSAASRAVMTVMNDPSDGNVNQVMDGLDRMYPGQKATWDSERQAILALPPSQRATYAYQKGIGQLDAHDAMLRSPYGDTAPTNLGNVQAPGTTTQASPWNPAGTRYGPATTLGAPPGQMVGTGTWVSDGKGGRIWQPTNMPASTIQPGGQPGGTPQTGGGGNANAPPIAPPPGTTLRGGYTPRPSASSATPPPANAPSPDASSALPVPPVPPADATPSPDATPAPAPSPAPAAAQPAGNGAAAVAAAKAQAAQTNQPVAIPGGQGLFAFPNGNVGPSRGGVNAPTDSMTPGPRADLGGGVQVASATPSAPTVGPASPAGPAVAGNVAAIQAGMANAAAARRGGVQTAQAGPPAGTPLGGGGVIQTPQGPMVASGPPMGYGERLKQDQTAYAADQSNLPAHVTNVQNLNTALDALELTNTGRSTGAVHNFYSFLTSQGIAPGFVDNDVTQYDIARKAMMAFAASRAGGTAGTDLARVQAELANASPEIAQGAAEHVLKQNLGLENMEIAANRAQQDKSGAGYGDNKAQFYRDNDPRAFAWDRYSPTERADIMAKAGKTEGGLAKLRSSLRNAIDAGVVQVPKQQSQATPTNGNGSPPPTNALAAAAPTGQPNALAA